MTCDLFHFYIFNVLGMLHISDCIDARRIRFLYTFVFIWSSWKMFVCCTDSGVRTFIYIIFILTVLCYVAVLCYV